MTVISGRKGDCPQDYLLDDLALDDGSVHVQVKSDLVASSSDIPVTEFRSQHSITRLGGESSSFGASECLSSGDCGEISTLLCLEPWILPHHRNQITGRLGSSECQAGGKCWNCDTNNT